MQHNMPNNPEVIKTWPFDLPPKDWNNCYQVLLDRVTDSDIEANKIGADDYTQLYELCALQSHFVQTAIAGLFFFVLLACSCLMIKAD
jgi:hypothetical protein